MRKKISSSEDRGDATPAAVQHEHHLGMTSDATSTTNLDVCHSIGITQQGETIVSSNVEGENELRKVHIIVTGGTIGMKKNDAGAYEPTKGFLEQIVSELPPLHDRHFTRSFQDYPKGYCTPELLMDDGQRSRIFYTYYEFPHPIDSSDMSFDGWVSIAEIIEKEYHRYDGFLVIHGTDTMAFTASALSFMLENLGKPVVLTGAQVSMDAPRSDGYWNFINALTAAGTIPIPEVTVMFNNKLFRGNRVTKHTSTSFDGFHSPHFPPLVEMGSSIVCKPDLFFVPTSERFHVDYNLCRDVITIWLNPGITAKSMRNMLSNGVKGAVLQTFGSGNSPTNDALRELLYEVIHRENEKDRVLVVNCSQCLQGNVTDAYKAGRVLSDAGVISMGDCTVEAALTKLYYVLALENTSYQEKCELMKNSQRGEMTHVLHILPDKKSDVAVASLPRSVQGAYVCSIIYQKDVEAIKTLLKAHPILSVRSVDENGVSPLHIACNLGWLEGVEYLIDEGCIVHIKDAHGRTPLIEAIESKNIQVVQKLLNTGASLEQLHNQEIGMNMCLAASKGDIELVQAWVCACENTMHADYLGNTPMDVAKKLENEELVAFLETLTTNSN